MKRTIFSLLILLFMQQFTFAQVQPTTVLPPLVNVSGYGEVKVQPDEISLQVAVETRDKSLDEAKKQNDKNVAAILAYLKKSGVDAKNVQTTYMSVQPIYSGNFGQATPDVYTATKTINVLVKKISSFDELMAGIYKAGANRVDGIDFRTSDLQKHREQARKLAVQAARQKATALTSELGAKVGRVYSINESGNNYPGPIAYGRANKMMESAAFDGAGGSTIAAGEIIVSASVDVSFLIE
ncbi:SIMPL domain-containing protein [Adhaeribacter swui]|uniref:SIMPL domain-containing protein n=1 Tax=Adhaeribacter swui TaxID=2086471 RepID=A0A7G7G7B2_9BACT|nr:SIMPL domain-containing protein [Adhaeribacter swui]QNF33046.1 SIMPL domain-containing protein [Adhaeribacter swui]